MRIASRFSILEKREAIFYSCGCEVFAGFALLTCLNCQYQSNSPSNLLKPGENHVDGGRNNVHDEVGAAEHLPIDLTRGLDLEMELCVA